MPNPSKGARLYRRPGAREWSIREGGAERRTGTADRREAEAALARYIASRDLRPSGAAEPEALTVAAALAIYGEEHAPHVAAPERIGYAIAALVAWWKDAAVADVTAAACRRYARERKAGDGTIRRELGTLRAALRHCAAEGYLTAAPPVTLPDRPDPRDRWLTRDEAARLLRACRSDPMTRHLARFIIVGLYSGSRRDVILGLRFDAHPGGGHIDLAAGLLYRRPIGSRETKKRARPARLPRRLAAHARGWAHEGGWVVNWRGQRIASVKTAWGKAVKRAGLTGVTPHTLRHTAITWAMQAGVPLADASGFFSVSIRTLEEVYLHHHPDFQRATAGALDRGVGR